jgi:hypothetical protein
MNPCVKMLVVLFLLVAGPAFGQGRQTSVKVHAVIGIESAPPAAPNIGDRYLIGPSPSGPWALQSGKIATATGSGWTTKAVDIPDQIYDASAAAIYAQTGVPSPSNLWNGSTYVRLSPGFPKYKVGAAVVGNLFIGADFADHSITASPEQPATFLLGSPAIDTDIFGIVVRIEKYPGTQESLTIDVEGDGTLCDQDLNNLAPLTITNTAGKVLNLRAGDQASHCIWYLEGYVP